MFKQAADAWATEWGKKPIVLKKSDPGPVELGRPRGDGGYSYIHETSFRNVHLAVKILRSKQPKVFEKQKEEILMLEKISKSRHSHVVGLVGSYLYEEKRQGCFEIGILIWPLAHCDLRMVLENIDALSAWIGRLKDTNIPDSNGRGQPEFEKDIILAVINRKSLGNVNSSAEMRSVRRRCRTRLERSFGCMLAAVAWLHSKSIRHRDLKPAQFLVSRDGLWLTDFGCSKEVELGTTSTYGEDRITVKYHSPERERAVRNGSDGTDRTKHGYPEDTFALGCTYLEMQFRILQVSRSDCPGPWEHKKEGWSYQANIDRIQTWMKPFKKKDDVGTTQSELADGVVWMMTYDVAKRPTIKQVRHWMSNEQCFWHLKDGSWSHDLFDSCCKPPLPSALQTPKPIGCEMPPMSVPLVESDDRKPSRSESRAGTNCQRASAALGPSETVKSSALKGENRSSQDRDSRHVSSDRRGNDVDLDRADKSIDTSKRRRSEAIDQGQGAAETEELLPKSRRSSNEKSNSVTNAQKTRADQSSVRPRSSSRISSSISTGQASEAIDHGQEKASARPTSAAKRLSDYHVPRKTSKDQASTGSNVSLSIRQQSSTAYQGHSKSERVRENDSRERSSRVTPKIAVTDTTVGIDADQLSRERRRSSFSTVNQLGNPRTDEKARNIMRLSADNLARHHRSTTTQDDVRAVGSSRTYENSRRGSDSSSPTTVHGIETVRMKNFRFKTSSDQGRYWCSSNGCAERFITPRHLSDHAKEQHPHDPLPVLLHYDLVKDNFKLSQSDKESSITCGVSLCYSRYSGCFKEQSLASHMKVRHSESLPPRRVAARRSFKSYDSTDTD